MKVLRALHLPDLEGRLALHQAVTDQTFRPFRRAMERELQVRRLEDRALVRRHLETIEGLWGSLAAVGWRLYLEAGPVALILAPGAGRETLEGYRVRTRFLRIGSAAIDEMGAWVATELRRLLRAYDPARQLVVMIHLEGGERQSVYLVEGEPPPTEAVAITSEALN